MTGTTGVAIYGCGASETSLTLTIEEVAADGSLTTVGTTAISPKGTTYDIVEHASTLDASKYYKATVGADYSRKCIFHQIRFTKSHTTGIQHPDNHTPSNGQWYNLSGQRIGTHYKGIAIINGKKVIMK